MKYFFFIFFFSFLFNSNSYSQKINSEKLDSLFDLLQTKGLATGSLSISINGKKEYQRAIGFASIENNRRFPINTETKFRIGSISKMFTAVMIFQLLEEGKINLNQNLADYFSEMPFANKITLEMMLFHRSGLHDYTDQANFSEWKNKSKTPKEMLKMISDKGLDFEPGSKANYSNSNYLLLSYIIEKITGLTYQEALTKRITSRIGLKNTQYGTAIDTKKNEAKSFKYVDSMWKEEKETDPGIHSGAGSIVSTPYDLTVFMENLFAQKLLSAESLKRMTSLIEGYGMGIFPYNYNSIKGYGHNGRIEEFYAAVRYYPDKNLAFSYITNGILYPRNDILQAILKIIFEDNYIIPFTGSIVTNLQEIIGTYSSKDLPFKVDCIDQNGILKVIAAGKKIEAKPVSTNYFMDLKTGSFFEFDPEKNELQIKETDNIYFLYKEK